MSFENEKLFHLKKPNKFFLLLLTSMYFIITINSKNWKDNNMDHLSKDVINLIRIILILIYSLNLIK